MRKARHARDARTLADLPNIGPAMIEDFRDIGIARPQQLVGKDPYALYDRLCRVTGVRHDPCVLDTFISAVRFMEGAPAHPWWHYTPERKARLATGG
ncbi:MAG: helix-hairpin-helix domain-containing protein [Luteimonas sp.]